MTVKDERGPGLDYLCYGLFICVFNLFFVYFRFKVFKRSPNNDLNNFSIMR